MKNYLEDKVRYYKVFADAVYKDFKAMRFGIGSCKPEADLALSEIRKELTDWQQREDNNALTTTSISYQTWLAVTYDQDTSVNIGGAGYMQSPVPIGPTNIGLGYNYAGGESQNVIQVNTGGCVTRINLNPSIQINHNSKYTHLQEVPASVWTIQHNFGFVPNVFIQDVDGVDIEGLIEPVNNSVLTITFSSPVAGTAYLS